MGVCSLQERHLYGVEKFWVDEYAQVSITDKERTLLDILIYPKMFGGIGAAFGIVEEQLEAIKIKQLIKYAVRYGKKSILKETFVFKGGTALKKIYFGNYRFSEDLDFSVVESPTGEALEEALYEAILDSKQLLAQYGPFEIDFKRNAERAPHPRGQEAFIANVKCPWHPKESAEISIESGSAWVIK